MYIILLKFSDNRTQAGQFMDGHKAWLQSGFDDGIFLLAGSIQSKQGGAILAHNTTRSDLESRVDGDPFDEEKVVTAEILEIAPAKANDQLSFLLG